VARQEKLFPEPAATIHVDQAYREPRLWVRRLIVWAKPGELVREVSLRRGLNIIWSPDPGATAADVGRQGGSGHGAGKSLFCRLLRYCLGEDTFANDDLRNRIGTAFPQGIVGAEVVVAGVTWGVVRPIGTTRRILAGEGTPEDLLASEARGVGTGPLLEAISRAILNDGIEEHMPGGREWRAWLLALAWLARDQDCRFGHLLEWRHTDADSRSPALGLTKDDHLTAVRLLVGAMTADEIATRKALEPLAEEKRRLEREVSYLAQAADRMGRLLATALTIEPTLLTAESLAANAIQARAQRNLSETEDRLAQEELTSDIPNLRQNLEDVIGKLALVGETQKRTQGLADLQQAQIGPLRGESANLDAEAIKARLGPVCPVCNVPIDEVLARGCGLSHVLPDREQIALDKTQLAAQLAACQAAIQEYQRQIRENDVAKRNLEAEEKKLREEIRKAEDALRRARDRRRQEWLGAAKIAEDARRLEGTHSDLGLAQTEITSVTEREDRLKEDLQAHRPRHAEVLARLSKLFEYVCRALLGAQTDAGLSVTGQGLRAEVQVGGTAMESLKAVAFDVAAMLMSMEGRTSLPALLIHDSPREADLGLSHYHRLFRLMAKLEAGSEPSFQYIVTTTTDPPEEMIGSDVVVLRLQGLEPEERLLRRDL
jgi:hypothetical protein